MTLTPLGEVILNAELPSGRARTGADREHGSEYPAQWS